MLTYFNRRRTAIDARDAGKMLDAYADGDADDCTKTLLLTTDEARVNESF